MNRQKPLRNLPTLYHVVTVDATPLALLPQHRKIFKVAPIDIATVLCYTKVTVAH